MSIKDLDPETPGSTDSAGFGDDQIRALKVALQAVFQEFDGLVRKGSGNPAATDVDLTALFDRVDTLEAGGGGGGAGFIVGQVVMWYGPYASIPGGWAVCDGSTQNGEVTPDLRNRFIVAANSTSGLPESGGKTQDTEWTGSTVSDGVHNHGGNTGNYSLKIGDLPDFSSAIRMQMSTGGGGSSGINHADSDHVAGGDSGASSITTQAVVDAIVGANAAAHGHTIGSEGLHSHDIGLPNWFALYFIMYVGVP